MAGDVRPLSRPPGWEAPAGWRRKKALARADVAAAILMALASALCAIPLFHGPYTWETPAFRGIAPGVCAVLFVAAIIMFAERERHGLVRVLLAGSAGALVISALFLLRRVPAWKVLLSYGVPAILVILSAGVLFQGHRAAGRSVKVKQRRPPTSA